MTPHTAAPFRRKALDTALLLACFCLAVPPAHSGGFVTAKDPIIPSRPAVGFTTPPAVVFNNASFTDLLTIGPVNNDPIRTPSTTDPISTVTGNNFHDETDLVIRGRNGLNYVFTRTYNSQKSASAKLGDLGYGWVHSYGMRLVSNDFGNCPNCTAAQDPLNGNGKTSSLTYTDERGGDHNYLVTEDAAHAVTAPQGEFDSLAFNTPAPGQHTLAFRNGAQYMFESEAGVDLRATPGKTARLKSIKNAWGDVLTLSYDTSAWPGRLTGVTDNLGISGRSGLAFTYHPGGRLKDVTDWSGRIWRFTYNANNELTGRSNPLAEVRAYTYHPKHLLHEVIQPLARDGQAVKTVFTYYENARGYTQTDGLGQGDLLDYDLFRKSTRVTDSLGRSRDYHYDENGRMTKLIEPDGGILLFENQGDAIRGKKYDALGYATTYSYRADKTFTGTSDSHGNVTREQDALGNTVDTSYGPLDQIASVKDKRGTVSTTAYAASTTATAQACGDYTQRPKETRLNSLNGSADVLLASQCWNPDATLNTSRQYLDASHYRETRLTYSGNGLNVSQQQSVGLPSGVTVTQTTTYDSLGRKKTKTLKRRASPTNAALIDLTTTYDYDALDRVIKTTDPLGNEALNRFDANGQLWQVTHRYKKSDGTYDERNLVTRTFDAAERVKTETDAEGHVTTYQYDAAGNVLAVTDAEGHTAQVEYDAMNRQTAVIGATGYRTQTAYNQRGEVLSITNANNETVEFEYDALGRKTAQIDPMGYRTEYQYDANGNLTCVIDANAEAGIQPKNADGCTVSTQYDELNRPIRVKDAQNGVTQTAYDRAGHRLSVTDAENKTHSFAYDDLGRLNSETDPAGKSTAYQTDEAGNLYQKTNRLNEVSRYSYDPGNRLTRIDNLKDNSAETFGYDAAGNRNAAANGTVSYAFTWDRLNRLTGKTDSRGRSLAFTFDKVGNLLTKTTYQGSTTRYTYNAANRLVSLRNPDYLQVDYQYDPAGRLLTRVMSSGAKSVHQYDAAGRLSYLAQYDAAGALIADSLYTRDRLGHILTQTDLGALTSYGYDPLYRLKTADYPGTANDELFTYDLVGNRKTATKGSLTANANTRYYNYTAGTNRLADIRIGSIAGTLESGFVHDDEGRMTSQTGVGAKTLAWDAKGRLWTLTNGSSTEVYAYDPMDYRIGRSGGALGNLDYFLEGEHLESVYQSGALREKYFRGSSTDELVAAYLTDTDGKLKPFLFHHDQVNSVSAVSGHNGGVIQSVSYGAFGAPQSTTGSSPNRLKYTGREDEGNGCYYYRARYYCSDIGRFISEDPLGFAAGDVNFYAYVGNDAVNASDPSGLAAYLGAKPIADGPDKKNFPHHTVILMIPDNPKDFGNRTGWKDMGNGYISSTLSGQPSEGDQWITAIPSNPDNKLIYTPNHPSDQIQNLTELQRIPTPNGMTDTQHISGLIKSAASYKNNAQYNLAPVEEGGYNSNSFTAGVIRSAGGTPPKIDYSAPGYPKPLPLNTGTSAYPSTLNSNMTRAVYSKKR